MWEFGLLLKAAHLLLGKYYVLLEKRNASQGSTFASLRHDWTKICNFTLILKLKSTGVVPFKKLQIRRFSIFGIGTPLNKKPSFHGEKRLKIIIKNTINKWCKVPHGK